MIESNSIYKAFGSQISNFKKTIFITKIYTLKVTQTNSLYYINKLKIKGMQFTRFLASSTAGTSFLGRATVQSRVSSVIFALKGAPSVPSLVPHAVSTNSAAG